MLRRRMIWHRYKHMNDPRNDRNSTIRRALPFFVEFVKFSIGFAVIIAVALIALRVADAAMR